MKQTKKIILKFHKGAFDLSNCIITLFELSNIISVINNIGCVRFIYVNAVSEVKTNFRCVRFIEHYIIFFSVSRKTKKWHRVFYSSEHLYFITIDVVWYFRRFPYNPGNGDDRLYSVTADANIGGGICHVWSL